MDEGQGVHASIAVESDCPAATAAADLGADRVVPGVDDSRPQAVVPDPGAAADHARVAAVVPRGRDAVCRLRGCDGDCPVCDLDFLPVEPLQVRCAGGELVFDLVATGGDEVRAVVSALEGPAADVEPLKLAAPDGDGAGTAVVDLSALTARQRQVAAAALERGYFQRDADPAALAADLGVSQSTLSEHLRAVQSELFRQVFPAGDGE